MAKHRGHLAGEETRGRYRWGDVVVYELEHRRRYAPRHKGAVERPLLRPAALAAAVNEERLYAICGAMAAH